MRFAINQVTLGERDFREVAEACSQAGFTAMEFWLPHIQAYLAGGHSVCDVRAILNDNGVVAAGACFVMGLLGSNAESKREAFDVAKARFELCQELGAGAIACVGDGPEQPSPEDYDHAVERAREIGDLAESFDLTVGLEFVAGLPFLGTLATTGRLVAQADHSHVGVLLDTFHFWAGRSKMADFDGLGDAPITFVHLNDVANAPRETLTDTERVLPGDGVLPLADVMARVEATGYDGYYSLELFDRTLWEQPPAEAARRAFAACQRLAR
ncbi:MAG: sugar phosphate isomerase/epimerase family protein [Planctomycetota bacterium]